MRADKQTVTRLLKTARGQLDGILAMVENDRYCVDISNQVMATQSILTKANKEILKAHIGGCVQEAFESGDPALQAEKMDEVLALMDKLRTDWKIGSEKTRFLRSFALCFPLRFFPISVYFSCTRLQGVPDESVLRVYGRSLSGFVLHSACPIMS